MDRKEKVDKWYEKRWKKTADLKPENNTEGPPIIGAEVTEPVHQMKNNKAPDPDNITKDELEVLEEYGVEIITKLLSNINNIG